MRESAGTEGVRAPSRTKRAVAHQATRSGLAVALLKRGLIRALVRNIAVALIFYKLSARIK